MLDERLKKVNFYGVFVSSVLLIVLLALFGFNLYLNSQLTSLSKQKQSISNQLSRENTQFKINYISNKADQIKEFDKNDAHFTTYYEYLKDAFTNTDVPLFTSFKLDNHQNVQLGFEVGSYDEMQKVIGFVESERFLRHFKTLSIKAASFSQNLGSEKNTLQFVGIIKNVDSEI